MNKTFATPIDASNYCAGAGTAYGCRILGINYEENRYRFQLLDENEAVMCDGAVFGVNVETAREANARTDIRDAVAATILE